MTRVTGKNTHCGGSVGGTPGASTRSEVCGNFGTTLRLDNGVLYRTESTIGDGWYAEFKLENGCVTAVRAATPPVVTPLPCAPSPCGCGGGGGGGGDGVELHPSTTNILNWVGGRLNAELHIEGVHPVVVTGAGTSNDPMRISADLAGDGVVFASSSTIEITGTGSSTDAYQMNMRQVISPGTYGSVTVDQFGRVTGAASTGMSDIRNFISGNGTEFTLTGGIASYNLAHVLNAGQVLCGGNTVRYNEFGQITNVVRSINVVADTYVLGKYSVSVNDTGSITSIVLDTTAASTVFTSAEQAYLTSYDGEDTRTVTFNTERATRIGVEYRGHLGSIRAGLGVRPGLVRLPSADVVLSVDGVAVGDMLFELVYGGKEDTESSSYDIYDIIAVRGVTPSMVAAGYHGALIYSETFDGGALNRDVPGILRVIAVE